MGTAPASSDSVKQELERVLQGKAFRNTEALRKLLRFVVERTLDGDEASLKEYTLGYQVLQRGVDFDPQADPIVRVQAGRLRTKLEEYYGAEGKDNAVRIALPKGGYVPDFIRAEAAEPSTAPSPPPQRTRFPMRVAWLAGAAVALVAATYLLIRPTPVEPRRDVVRVALRPPPDSGFLAFSLSPDSGRLAMIIADLRGKSKLWLRNMDALEPSVVAGSEGAIDTPPFWSRDSRFVGFFAAGELRKVDTSTGLVQTICKAPRGRGGTWNRDGVIVFAGGINSPLVRVNESGGIPTPVTKFEPTRVENSHRWPWFLPDGRRFLYYVRAALADNSGIYLGDLAGSAARKILRADTGAVYVSSGYMLFQRPGIILAQRFDPDVARLIGEPVSVAAAAPIMTSRWTQFSASDFGTLILMEKKSVPDADADRDLVWVDQSGRPKRSIGKIGHTVHISLSLDGERVAYDHPIPNGAGDNFVLDVSRGVTTRITFPPAIGTMPVISRDGKQVAFSSNTGGSNDLYAKELVSAASPRLLLHSWESKYPTDWSPDGRYLLFDQVDAGGVKGTWVLPATSADKPFLFQPGAMLGQFSPDGRWIAYVAQDGGSKEVFVTAFPSKGTKWQVSNRGGSKPRWSGDGQKLLYLASDTRLMSVDVKTRSAIFESGTPKPLFETQFFFDDERVPYAVNRNGTEFLLLTPERIETSALTMVLNWPSLLVQRK